MKSPKSQFLEDKIAVKMHGDLVVSDMFMKAVNTALLQQAFMNGGGKVDSNTAAAAHYKLCGAQEFLAILLTLADIPRLPTNKEPDNLNWNA